MHEIGGRKCMGWEEGSAWYWRKEMYEMGGRKEVYGREERKSMGFVKENVWDGRKVKFMG